MEGPPVIVESLSIPDVRLIKPRIWRDQRGQFIETWRGAEYETHGIGPFVQDNASVSKRGVLRGLHLQHPNGQAKLVSALRGKVFDVAVDVRAGSPTFGNWVGVELSDENGWQLYIPAGFAHGFQALADDVVFAYKCTEYYSPASERTVRWDDPDVAIDWPLRSPIVASKDANAPLLQEFEPHWLPQHERR
jgi:dTDP-4-dehydrorhamnose 3,5-epimerase